jgi:hypothetical protein
VTCDRSGTPVMSIEAARVSMAPHTSDLLGHFEDMVAEVIKPDCRTWTPGPTPCSPPSKQPSDVEDDLINNCSVAVSKQAGIEAGDMTQVAAAKCMGPTEPGPPMASPTLESFKNVGGTLHQLCSEPSTEATANSSVPNQEVVISLSMNQSLHSSCALHPLHCRNSMS